MQTAPKFCQRVVQHLWEVQLLQARLSFCIGGGIWCCRPSSRACKNDLPAKATTMMLVRITIKKAACEICIQRKNNRMYASTPAPEHVAPILKVIVPPCFNASPSEPSRSSATLQGFWGLVVAALVLFNLGRSRLEASPRQLLQSPDTAQ